MKRLLFPFIAFLLLASCTKDVEYMYDSKGRIYFQFQKWNPKGYFMPLDSVVFSFGKLAEEITVDTAEILVQVLGDASPVDRRYKVRVVEEGAFIKGTTTMQEGVHYEPLEDSYIFHADKLVDTLKIVLLRENLSTSLRRPEIRSMILKLEESNDFELGAIEGYETKLSVNNFLLPPKWWESNTVYLGFYHPKKWMLLIDLDPLFENEEEFAGTGVDMYNKGLMLQDYLRKNILIDDETGMRITFDGLEEINE